MDSLEAFGVVWGGRRDPEQGTELETDGAGAEAGAASKDE